MPVLLNDTIGCRLDAVWLFEAVELLINSRKNAH